MSVAQDHVEIVRANTRIQALEQRVKELEAERDNFRKVLEGMAFNNLDLIAAEKRDTTIIGEKAHDRINEIIKERESLRAGNERLKAQIKQAQAMYPFLRDDEMGGGA